MDDPVSHGLDPGGHLAAAAADCVHCGFCLPACPTYQLWGEEMDSPRGRIHLISQVLDGAPVTEPVMTHLDRCLGCMACMPACPSGVRYNELIEAARSWPQGTEPGAGPGQVEPGTARSLRERAVRAAIFATFPYPKRLRALTGPLRAAQRAGLDRLAQRGPVLRYAPELAASLRVAPRSPTGRGAGRARRGGAPRAAPLPARGGLPARIPARGQRRAVVGMLTGCVQRVFFPGVNEATARVLAAEGCDVIVPPDQGCCGALSLHSGRAAEAARFAERTIAVFERAGVDAVVVNSAGCGSAMKEFGAVFTRAAASGIAHPGGSPGRASPATAAASGPAANSAAGPPSPSTGPAANSAAAGSPSPSTGPAANSAAAGPASPSTGPAADSLAARASAFSAGVRDFSEFLAELYERHGGPRAERHALPVTAAYHDACHLAHAQRIRREPRDLLRAIPGLDLTEAGDGGTCCGSAGVYNLVQPQAAAELGQRKAAALRATGARLIVSANPGCSLQIAAAMAADGGEPVAVAHIAEVLDASLRGLPLTALG